MEIIQINETTWRMEEDGVRFFLLTGRKKALLIDSGMQTRNARQIAQTLTDLPVELLNTHADPDHVGSNGEFTCFYMNPAEAPNYYKRGEKREGSIVPVENGDVLDLGERPLEIITLPGHTTGSIAVLDIRNRALISGDPIQDGNIYMFGPYREMHAYLLSLNKLDAYRSRFDEVWPSHGSFPVEPAQIDRLKVGALLVMQGQAPREEMELHGSRIVRCDVGCAGFYCER